ncbi:hypothetical protein ACUOBA_41040 [Escherichia coli]
MLHNIAHNHFRSPVEEAKQHIVKALRNKKHVVTANKDLMAVYGAELLQLANDND